MTVIMDQNAKCGRCGHSRFDHAPVMPGGVTACRANTPNGGHWMEWPPCTCAQFVEAAAVAPAAQLSLVRTTQETRDLLQEDLARAAQLTQRDLSPATRRAYASDWAAWCRWCREREVAPAPVDRDMLHAWLGWLGTNGAKASNLRRKLASLRVIAHELGQPILPSQETTNLVGALEKRVVFRRQKQAQPLMPRDLAPLCLYLARRPPSDRTALRDRALILLGWCGMLRAGELVQVTGDCITWLDGKASVDLRGMSKTDRAGRRNEHVELGKGRTEETCPLAALRLLQSKLADPTGPLFLSAAGAPLDRGDVGRILERRARAAGLGGGWSGHSLRRGAATAAVDAGVPEALVKSQGRWTRVETFQKYLDKRELRAVIPTAGLV